MKLKTLLLGSAAAFAVGGAAQAADLSIAEPVDYVRVCDAFGVGYWYIPQTDTCIKIGGFVRMDINFHELKGVWNDDMGMAKHSSTWDFVTTAGLNFTAKSMTEFGELVGYVGLTGSYNNAGNGGSDGGVSLDDAWLSLGPVLFGHKGSSQNTDGGFSDISFRPDNGVDQITLSWAASGFGIFLGIEDPRDRWGSDLPKTYSMPDIVGAITASMGHVDGKLTAGWAQLDPKVGSVYGVAGQLTFNLDSVAAGDKLAIGGSFGTGTKFVASQGQFPGGNGNTMWAAFASIKHYFSPTVSAALTGTYGANSTTGVNVYAIGGDLIWAPVTGFSTRLHGDYSKASNAATGVWTAQVRVKREW